MITRARQPSELGLHVLTAIHQTPSAAQCHSLTVEYIFEVTLLIFKLQVMKKNILKVHYWTREGDLVRNETEFSLVSDGSIIMPVVTDIQFKMTEPSSGHDHLFHSFTP